MRKRFDFSAGKAIWLFIKLKDYFRFVFFLIILAGINSLSCQQKKHQFLDVIEVGPQRELFVNDYLIERLSGKAEFRLNHPTPQNIILEMNEPWEGNNTNYVTVFKDDTKYRMYYRAGHISYLKGKDRPDTREVYCYAESLDGINWIKPEMGLFSCNGSKKNNIILDGVGRHSFSPFKDTNPQCSTDAKYKAFGFRGGGEHGLYAFKSIDGIHWNLMDSIPVITKGDFDSQNIAFWDTQRGEYRAYHRNGRNDSIALATGIDPGRDINTATSHDFINWTVPVFLGYSAIVDPGNHNAASTTTGNTIGKEYPSGRVSQLYTNQIIPYYRAPNLLIGFPTRYIDRGWTESAKALPRYDYRQVRAKLSETNSTREGTAITDGMIMSSRDRNHFWIWPESFLRPGLRERDSWFYGDMYQAWGLVETRSAMEDAPSELSLYATERARQDKGTLLRRYTIRIDGFVSLHAPLAGGEIVTKPITFTGNSLFLNVSTSAAGSVRVEVQNRDGQPLPGFMLADSYEIYGDDLERAVGWKGNPDLATLAGKPVRLRFVIRDADIYSFIFQERTR